MEISIVHIVYDVFGGKAFHETYGGFYIWVCLHLFKELWNTLEQYNIDLGISVNMSYDNNLFTHTILLLFIGPATMTGDSLWKGMTGCTTLDMFTISLQY